MKDENKKSSTEMVIDHLVMLMNAAEDKKAMQRHKEARFRQSLGIRLQVPKKKESEE